MIPGQLQNNQFRFVKIRKGEKGPFEKEWQKTKNYKWDKCWKFDGVCARCPQCNFPAHESV